MDELRRSGAVGEDSPHSGGSQENIFRLLGRKKAPDRGGIAQVELFTRPSDHVAITMHPETAANRGAHQTAMTGDENSGGCFHSAEPADILTDHRNKRSAILV